MLKRFYRQNRNLLRNRFISCAALILYFTALVALPTMHHHHSGSHSDDGAKNGYGSSTSCIAPDNTCPICEFVHLTVPFFSVSEPIGIPELHVSLISFADPIPYAVQTANFPPCRAPPIF